MDFTTVALVISDDAREKMEDRGITEADVREVLAYAEGEGVKMVQDGGDTCIGRKKLGNFTAYVEYIVTEDAVEVNSVYSHVVAFVSELEE